MASCNKIFYDAGPIGSVASLAKTLSFTESFLLNVAGNPAAFYTVFSKKIKEKERTLADPHPALKVLHQRIISRIFTHLEFPPYLHGGIRTDDPRDFITNASAHTKAETAITLDIQRFFPSIRPAQVNYVFKNLFKFSPEVANVLTGVVTLNDEIPQGAPTSSYIANLVMWEEECKLVARLNGKGFSYTRLIDDMTISSPKKIVEKDITRVVDDVAGMLAKFGYKLHPKKKNIYSRSDPEKLMLITGVWMNRGSPKLLKERRLEISKEVIGVRKIADEPGMLYDEKYHAKHASALGKVVLLQRLGHARSKRLRDLLNNVQPMFDSATCTKIETLIKRFTLKTANKEKIGYIRQFYKFQHMVSIIKRTDPPLAKKLQATLNKKRPTKTMRDLYA
jgi:hypothetical protein